MQRARDRLFCHPLPSKSVRLMHRAGRKVTCGHGLVAPPGHGATSGDNMRVGAACPPIPGCPNRCHLVQCLLVPGVTCPSPGDPHSASPSPATAQLRFLPKGR